MTASKARESRSYTGPVTPTAETATVAHYAGELTSRLADTRANARREAAEHRPPSDAVRMDKNEVELQTDAEKAIATEHQIFRHVLTEASRDAHELQEKAPELEGRIQQVLADDSLQSEVAATLAEEKATLVSVAEERMRAEVDLRSFRARHGIAEQAVYPESHIWHFAIIASLALVETIVNAFFYENAQGLLGGFVVALGVAAVNMSGALVLGMLFRFKNLIDREKRAGGWACLVIFAVLSVYCNALFAAFRAEYQLLADPTDAAQVRRAFRIAAEQAGRVFMLNMQFGDLMSFVLFGIGLLLSCFAFYKGYTFDDRFPGHGAKDRAARDARKSEQERQEVARQKIKDFLQRRRRELQALSREPADLMSAATKRAAGVQHAHTVFQMHQEAIQRDFSLLLRSYRDENTAIRATEPPSYFSYIPDIHVNLDEGVMGGILHILSTANARAQAVRDKYQDALNSKLNEVQRDTAILLDSTFSEFLRSVEREAEASINRSTISIQRTGVGVRVNDAY